MENRKNLTIGNSLNYDLILEKFLLVMFNNCGAVHFLGVSLFASLKNGTEESLIMLDCGVMWDK